MELRSRRKNDPSPARDMSLRILLASIGLAIYASVLEAQSISIDKLAECSDERIRALTKASAGRCRRTWSVVGRGRVSQLANVDARHSICKITF